MCVTLHTVHCKLYRYQANFLARNSEIPPYMYQKRSWFCFFDLQYLYR